MVWSQGQLLAIQVVQRDMHVASSRLAKPKEMAGILGCASPILASRVR